MKQNLREIYLDAQKELYTAFHKVYKYGDILHDKLDEIRSDVSYIGQNALAMREMVREILKVVKQNDGNTGHNSRQDDVKIVTVEHFKKDDLVVMVNGKELDLTNSGNVTLSFDK